MTQPDPNTTPAPGATPPADPAPPANPAAAPATGDGLGEAGKKALAEERAARKALEAEIKALKDRDPVKAIAEALGVKPSNEPDAVAKLTEQVQQMQKAARDAEARAMRVEVAAEKKLPAELASRLVGSTREELAADADKLAALIPTAGTPALSTPGNPAPDPSQGSRGGVGDLDAAIQAAMQAGNVGESIRLKSLKSQMAREKQI